MRPDILDKVPHHRFYDRPDSTTWNSVTVISLVAQKQLLNEMTKSLRDETLADIYQYLDSFVRMPPRVAAIAGDAINKKVVDATSFNQMKVYTFSIWKSSEVTSAYYIDLGRCLLSSC